MKKTILLFTLFLASFYGFSQDALYGVRAGYTISNLDFEPMVPAGVENAHRNGFFIGFFGEYGLSNTLAFAPEIQFSAEGAKDQNLRINYIQMPLFFKFQISENFTLGLGPVASIKGHEYNDGFKNFGFSGLGGLEYMISEEFFIDFRYSYGLTNVLDDNSANLEAKNTNMQIGLGVKF
ncbi:porin family protein [Olleya aquimaris]|uniref:Outer membrane protein with beta-barrel domain n=1 Tax=Olleya aquimaris TaxID=639310 RepID=A0A327R984_9FLAO|nr:porin family protein [Olleya aquimaris]RAJ12043.1 outer membrane protein with beta-barrel domain [Olleya aquimaris]